jgi:hypothetical protein
MKLIFDNFESHFCKSMSLFDRPKSNQKGATGPRSPDPPFIHPGLLAGLRHPWPFDWQLSLGFRSRPLFFIREKKRRRRHRSFRVLNDVSELITVNM